MDSQLARQVMTPAPVHVGPESTVADVARLMRDQDIGTVLVHDGVTVGLVTDRDLALRVLAEGLGPATEVRRVATPEPVWVLAEDSTDLVAEAMRVHGIRRVLVLEDGRAVGIISLGDLAVDRDPRSLLADISRQPPNN